MRNKILAAVLIVGAAASAQRPLNPVFTPEPGPVYGTASGHSGGSYTMTFHTTADGLAVSTTTYCDSMTAPDGSCHHIVEVKPAPPKPKPHWWKRAWSAFWRDLGNALGEAMSSR